MAKRLLWMDAKGEKALKSKQNSAVKYKKGIVIGDKKDIQDILDNSVIIELLEQSSFSDGLEGATVRFRFKPEKH